MKRIVVVAIVLGLAVLAVPSAMAAFPGQNGKIIFISSRDGVIYTMNPDGSDQTALSYETWLLTGPGQPAVSPEGERIALESSCDVCYKGNGVWIMNFDGSNPVQVGGWGIVTGPSWSPSGTQIAYALWGWGFELWIVDDDGTNAHQLLGKHKGPLFSDVQPAWSPDGKKIAFATDRGGNWEIYLVNADGTNEINLTNNPASDFDNVGGGPGPSWSPDGSKIAFESNRDGNYQIYVMNADGSNVKRLTTDPSLEDSSPAWSPDGTKIVFTRNSGGQYDIFVMDADGTNQTRLTTDPGWDGAPDWQPVGVVQKIIMTLKPTSLTFAKQLLGTTSSAKSIRLTNSGTATATISNIVATGNFAQTNNCPGTLAAGGNCTVNITITPTVLGAVSGAISFYDDAPDSPQVVALSGAGIAAVAVAPASLSFGTVNVGTTAAAQTVTVTNNSAASVSLSFAASKDYGASPGSQNGCGATLAAKANCIIAVTFSPTQSGTINGSLAISGSGFATQMVALTGSGGGGPTATLSFSPATTSIANQLIGTTSAPKVVTITNNGTSAVTIGSLTASVGFTAAGSGGTRCGGALAAGAKCTFSVTFTPSVKGSINGSVTIANNSPISPLLYSVSGTGVLPVTLSPTSLTFAAQGVGTASPPKTVTLTNNQTVLLNIAAITASGDYAATPGGTTPCGASVAPKKKCTFQVTFTPTITGTIKGAVDIAHNAPGSPQVVGLSGTGQ
jgi:Tol biopolymer transport system component